MIFRGRDALVNRTALSQRANPPRGHHAMGDFTRVSRTGERIGLRPNAGAGHARARTPGVDQKTGQQNQCQNGDRATHLTREVAARRRL